MATPPGMKKSTMWWMSLLPCQSVSFFRETFMSGDTTRHENNFSEEKTMKKPIPPDLLAQLRSHQQYTETLGKEGKKLEARGLDLSELDLSSRNLVCAESPRSKV